MTDNKAPQRKGARNSTSQKILSAGLATAACLGVTGVVAVRTVQANAAEASAQQAAPVADSGSVDAAWAELDSYAQTLANERAALDAYRADLVTTAKKLNRQIAQQQPGDSPTVRVLPTVRKPVTKPKAKPPVTAQAPRPAAPPQVSKPQANTKSS